MTTETKALAIPASGLDSAIQAAVSLGKEGVETLRELYAIEKERRADSARAAFFNAVSDLHARIGSIHKNREAKFATKSGAQVKYRYADLHAIATALRKHTGPLGLAWRWGSEGDEHGIKVTCTASHRDGHSESATWRAPIEGGNPMTSDSQKAKIATTFAQRVTLIQVFGLTDTEDDVDGMMPEDGSHDVQDVPFGPETITEEQAANLQALAEEVGADRGKFLAWLGVARLAECPASKLKAATAMLERKRKEVRK